MPGYCKGLSYSRAIDIDADIEMEIDRCSRFQKGGNMDRG